MMMLFSVGVSLSVIFALAWTWGRRIENYSLVDAFWAFGIAGAGIAFAVLGDGDLAKRCAAGGLAALWGFRLGWHLQKRIRKHHPEEDSRYQDLRESWSAMGFFWFFQIQALSVLLLALPYFLVSRDGTGWSLWESLGLAIGLIGLLGEMTADRQMSAFKETNSDSKAVCKEGLWRYSRHPNYFFESVIWVGVYVFACGSAFGWATIHAPLIITFLLLKVTGIPPMEASAVKRKGDAYREYQRTTSAFIPLPPKS